MPEIGNILGIAGHITLGVSVTSSVLCVLLGISSKSMIELGVIYRRQQNLVILIFISLVASLAILAYSLATDQFALKYVVEHSSTQMEIWYKIASLYSGQAGSLLIWTLAISLGTVLLGRTRTALCQYRRVHPITSLAYVR